MTMPMPAGGMGPHGVRLPVGRGALSARQYCQDGGESLHVRYPDVHVQLAGEDWNPDSIVEHTRSALRAAGADDGEIDAYLGGHLTLLQAPAVHDPDVGRDDLAGARSAGW